jgi:hypothetical protein
MKKVKDLADFESHPYNLWGCIVFIVSCCQHIGWNGYNAPTSTKVSWTHSRVLIFLICILLIFGTSWLIHLVYIMLSPIAWFSVPMVHVLKVVSCFETALTLIIKRMFLPSNYWLHSKKYWDFTRPRVFIIMPEDYDLFGTQSTI